MATIDADAHVVESEHTWDYMDPADRQYRPVLVTPNEVRLCWLMPKGQSSWVYSPSLTRNPAVVVL
jgi:hypothetical protein